MPDRAASKRAGTPAEVAVSSEDRATIARLAEEIVPALSATLAAAGLAEVEVRQAGWRVRVRRAAGGVPGARAGDAPQARRRSQDRGDRGDRADRPGRSGEHDGNDRANGSGPPGVHATRGRREAEIPDRFRAVATSPSVGPFRPDPELRRGARVREGDRLGIVDLLGVPQEVVSPVDGIVMAVLVEAEESVEYGQPLVELERATSGSGGAAVTSPGAGEG
jgi:biotin carboxyl carrier protein